MKVLKTVAIVAGAVALIATGVGAIAGTSLAVAGTTVGTIATYAGLAATVASIGAQLMMKPPPARGGVSQIIIQPDAPRPYPMGEGYLAGVRRYDDGYGGEVDDVKNPYRWIVDVYSGHGPVESIAPYFDFQPISSYYDGYLYTDTQLGACPEASALSPHYAGAPAWDSASKMSGNAAIGWNFRFDKKNKRFAAGIPVMGAYGQWVKIYDPRRDSTYPGGSGSHRLGDETTYEYSANPALHYAMYAYGRYQNGKKVIGPGFPAEGIDWPVICAWANVCDANDWTIFGRVFEPGDRALNLKDIAMAGGADPAFSGALLSVRYDAPRVSLATIGGADLADGDCSTTKMQSYSSRINTIVPKFIDPASNWELMPAQPIGFPALVTEDGEERRQEWPFNMVKSVAQAAQLAAYRVLNSREESPIVLHLLPHWRRARPGECYTLDMIEMGLGDDVIDVVILKRELNPADFSVTLTFMRETPAKHAEALAAVGVGTVPYGTGLTGEERDDVLAPGDTIYVGGDAETV